TFTSLKSPSPPQSRGSALTRCQCSPPSSERCTPPPCAAPSTAYMRPGSLAHIPTPMRPSLSSAVGRPTVIRRQVVPPSVDLYRPLLADRVLELTIFTDALRAAT